MNPVLATILRCPSCGSCLTTATAESTVPENALVCTGCRRRTVVRNGIPRFVDVLDDDVLRRTQASFGYEWTRFHDWRSSGETNFMDYFQALDLRSLESVLVLDAGCGMGRHARQIARFAGHVVAVDFSHAIDQAALNTADCPNVDCVQGDLLALPLADEAFDFVYCLGVLHHLRDTDRALASLVQKLRPGGRLRVYLYWKRHGWAGRVLGLVTWARRLTTRLPFPVLRAICFVISAALYGAVVLPYAALSRLGVRRHESWPLFVYARYPFSVMFNDQFDRFSAPLEKRYDPDEVRDLLHSAGLADIQVRSCFGWIADGIKPA